MKELNKWAENVEERRTIETFWSWLLKQHAGATGLSDVHIGNALDKYHGINRGKLEEERRHLVEEAKSGTYHDHTCGMVRRKC